MKFSSGLESEMPSRSRENDLCSERTDSAPPSPSGNSETGSTRGKRKHFKLCAVCGDKALGFNFDAVTCESCKAFFRRNAMKDEVPKCIFDQQCKVDVNTRRFCTYCRLQKCLQAGMKKDMILDDSQKRQRMEKVRQNRQRRQGVMKSSDTLTNSENNRGGMTPSLNLRTPTQAAVNPTPVVAAIVANPPPSISSSSASSVGSSVSPISNGAAAVVPEAVETPVSNLIPAHVVLAEIDCLQSAADNTSMENNLSLPTATEAIVKGELGSAWESVVEAVAPKAAVLPTKAPIEEETTTGSYSYESMTAISASVFSGSELPTTVYSNAVTNNNSSYVSLNETLSRKALARLLSQEEWNAVSDLTEAYKSSFLETSDKMPERKCSLINLVNTSGFIVRKLINFAKKLSDFTSLPQACQIALLKGVVLSTLFVRSATHFDPDRNVWITPRGHVPASILAEATGYRDLYEEHGKFCRQFLMVIDNDENLVPLIQVLSLFSPDRPLLGDEHQRVSDIQDRYICLIKHYLEARHGYVLARRRFQEVLACLGSLQTLTDNHGKVLLHVNPNEVDPLMLEVFDLKTTLLHEAEQHEEQPIRTVAAPENNARIFTKIS